VAHNLERAAIRVTIVNCRYFWYSSGKFGVKERQMGRIIVLGLFVLAIIFFILPWASVSCSGNELFSASGFDLVRGSYNVQGNLPLGVTLENEPIAIGVLIAAGVGVIFSIFRGNIWRYLRVLAGLTGIGLMVWLKFKIEDQIYNQGQGLLQINYLIGTWLTVGALALASIVGLILKDGAAKKTKPTTTPT
jgi:hypothetical protein